MDISGLYWRKSALNAGKCPPGLLALRNDRLTFTTTSNIEFDVPVADVTGKLSVWGSLVLTIDSRRYVFLTTVGQLAPAFSKTQQQAISAATKAKSLRTLLEWPALLTSAGAQVTAPARNYRPWLLGGLMVLLAVAAITLIVINGGI